MYEQSKGIVEEIGNGRFFEYIANKGVKQGDGTSCKLFTIFFYQVFP